MIQIDKSFSHTIAFRAYIVWVTWSADKQINIQGATRILFVSPTFNAYWRIFCLGYLIVFLANLSLCFLCYLDKECTLHMLSSTSLFRLMFGQPRPESMRETISKGAIYSCDIAVNSSMLSRAVAFSEAKCTPVVIFPENKLSHRRPDHNVSSDAMGLSMARKNDSFYAVHGLWKFSPIYIGLH